MPPEQPRLFDDLPFVAKKNEQGSLFDDPPEDAGEGTRVEAQVVDVDDEDVEEDAEETEDGDDEGGFPDDLFPFYRDGQELVAQCKRFVRLLLKRDDVTPRQVVGLGYLLAGLERLPRPTENLCISASVSIERGDSKIYQTLYLSSSEFRLENAGWSSGPFGGDSQFECVFEIEVGLYNDDDCPIGAYDWVGSACDNAKDESFVVEVEDTSDAPIQWDEEEPDEDEEDAWERLPVM